MTRRVLDTLLQEAQSFNPETSCIMHTGSCKLSGWTSLCCNCTVILDFSRTCSKIVFRTWDTKLFRVLWVCQTNSMEQITSWEAVTQVVKKFPVVYGTSSFIIMYTRARHWSLSWARWIRSTTPSRPIFLRSIPVLSSHLRLGLPNDLFPSLSLYVFLISPIRDTWPVHPIFYDFITLIMFCEEYRLTN